MMLMAKNAMNDGDFLNNKTKKLAVSRKIWPLPGVPDQEERARDASLQGMINRPVELRSGNVLGADDFAVFQGTIDENDRESFHCAISSILCVAQCFGILPLAGVCSESPRKLAFKIFSLRTAYAVAMMVMLLMIALISVCHMIQTVKVATSGDYEGITIATSLAIFHVNSLLGAVLFMRLAPRWISLQQDWRAMERFLDSRVKHQSPRLRRKFSTLTAAVMIFSLLEYLLFFAKLPTPEFWSSASNLTFEDALESITEKTYPVILTICKYNLGIGFFILFINAVGTFTSNFTNVLVMLVSTGLAERYKILNRRLMGTIHRRNIDWSQLRESYATMSTLVRRVDNNISPLIVLSFVNNLFIICLQLRNGISTQTNILEAIYFFSSFANLVGRTVAIMLLAAQINDQSRLALPELYNCPGPAYNIEAQRLQHQLSTDNVCLTGMRFFSITRNFILAVASTIVSYEVILLNSTSQLTIGNVTQ